MTPPSGECDLCGLPLPAPSVTADYPDRRYRFCCIGCRQVFAMLMAAADAPDPARFRETDLFRNCQALGIIPVSVDDIPPSTQTGAPETGQPAAEETPEGYLPLRLRIDGMWCPACAWVIESALKGQAGVRDAACNFSTDRIACRYDPRRTNPDALKAVINRLGYRAVPPKASEAATAQKKDLIRFGVSAFLTMNVMMLSFGLYAGFFSQFGRETIRNLSWPLFAMASIVLFYGGHPIYRRAVVGVAAAAVGMETLVAIGAFSAYFYSVVNLMAGSLHLYFDTASMLVTLVLLGKAIESRAKGEIREGLDAILSLRPAKARICTEGVPTGRYMAAEALREGDVFRVSDGETAPADGVVLTGDGLIDESSLTGEARPVRRKAGDQIRSGARVLRGDLTVRADAVGDASTLGRMLDIFEKALESRSRLEGGTDRILRWFVPAVVSLAVATGLGCLVGGLSGDAAMVRAVTVLVISCPCALGVAIPLTRVAGISLAGRQGLLVRDFSAFEAAERIDAVVFDKTGTLTRGQWRLDEIHSHPPTDRETALALAAGLEVESDHPVALEIRGAARREGLDPMEIESLKPHEIGVSGRWEGAEVRIGSGASIAQFLDHDIADPPLEKAADLLSTVYLSVDRRLAAVFRFGDALRPESAHVLTALRDSGFLIAIVSGDGQEAVDTIARALDAPDAAGGLLPQEKAARIRALQASGRRPAMVGDGVNDAPALAASELALAVHSGGRLGREAADVILMRDNLTQLIDFFNLSSRVNRKIRQNLVFTFLYNAVAIPLAMAGLLTPLVAVCAMLMSSLSVIGNTLHLMRTGKKSVGNSR